MQNLINQFEKAPKEVQNILSSLEIESTYEELNKANEKLKPLGYKINYYLNGCITSIKKLK